MASLPVEDLCINDRAMEMLFIAPLCRELSGALHVLTHVLAPVGLNCSRNSFFSSGPASCRGLPFVRACTEMASTKSHDDLHRFGRANLPT
jgi:hypothetical protein